MYAVAIATASFSSRFWNHGAQARIRTGDESVRDGAHHHRAAAINIIGVETINDQHPWKNETRPDQRSAGSGTHTNRA
jgi:hypothetical protein